MNISKIVITTPISICSLFVGISDRPEQESCDQNYFGIMSWSYHGSKNEGRVYVRFPSYLRDGNVDVEELNITLKHGSNKEESAEFIANPAHGFDTVRSINTGKLQISVPKTQWPRGKPVTWSNQPPLDKQKTLLVPATASAAGNYEQVSLNGLGIDDVIRKGFIMKLSSDERYCGVVFAGANTSTIADRPYATVQLSRLGPLPPLLEEVVKSQYESANAEPLLETDTVSSKSSTAGGTTKSTPQYMNQESAFYMTLVGNLLLAAGFLIVYLGLARRWLRLYSSRNGHSGGASSSTINTCSSAANARSNGNINSSSVTSTRGSLMHRFTESCLYPCADRQQLDESVVHTLALRPAMEDAELGLADSATSPSIGSAASSYVHLDHEELLIIDRHLLEEDSLDASERNAGDSSIATRSRTLSERSESEYSESESGFVHISESY